MKEAEKEVKRILMKECMWDSCLDWSLPNECENCNCYDEATAEIMVIMDKESKAVWELVDYYKRGESWVKGNLKVYFNKIEDFESFMERNEIRLNDYKELLELLISKNIYVVSSAFWMWVGKYVST